MLAAVVLVIVVCLLCTCYWTRPTLFDIVIPVGPNDAEFINRQLEYTVSNIRRYRKIFVVTPIDLVINKKFKNVTLIKDDMFPFSKNEMSPSKPNSPRSGWYLSQLIKLYAGVVIPGILERYLVIDADTCFLKPTTFIDSNNRPMFNTGTENHAPYFTHMAKLHPSLIKKTQESGVCHHMMFETRYVKELFDLVETLHNVPFYKAFTQSIEESEFEHSGASEYEIYYNFMLIYHPEQVTVRRLKWANGDIDKYDTALDYISYHHYIR